MKEKNTILKVLVLGMASAMMLTACGNDAAETETSATETAPALTTVEKAPVLKEAFDIYRKSGVDAALKYAIDIAKENGSLIDYNNSLWDEYDNTEYDNIIYNHVIKNDALNLLLGGRYLGADVNIYEGNGYTPEQCLDAHALLNFYSYIN